MSIKEQAAAWLRSVVTRHIAANIRRFQWRSYVDEISHNMLGGIRYLSPAEGKLLVHTRFVLPRAASASSVLVATPMAIRPMESAARP